MPRRINLPEHEHLWANGTFDLVFAAAQKIWDFPPKYADYMWMERSPFTVEFGVEPIPIKNQPLDPYESTSEKRKWDRLAAALRKDTFVKDAEWRSVNSAQVRVFIVPLISG